MMPAATGSRRPPGLPTWMIALLLGIALFGLYATTTGRLVGYEGETAAVAEGLVEHGQLRVFSGGAFGGPQVGIVRHGGHRYSRTGLTQPLLEVPFYLLGRGLDGLNPGGHPYRYRVMLLQLYNPVMAAITVVAIFGFLVARRRTIRWALVLALLCAVATILWPYAKIGLETTLMATLALAFLACAWAAARPTAWRLILAGVAAGAAAATKPYGILLILGLVPLLIGPMRGLDRPARLRGLVALLLPLAVWIVAIGWYNHYRTGSVANFGNPYYGEWLATPINAIGMFLSPGKGLVLYSPLVVLGLLGMRDLWRADRELGVAIVITVAANTVVLASTSQWGDETWGARYLVPSAWLLVVPTAWWVRGRTRRRCLAAVAALGVAIQLVGVLVAYPATAEGAVLLSGETVYPFSTGQLSPARAAYGPDGPRWIPEASPLLFQTEVVLAWIKEHLTGSGFVVTYKPYFGREGRADLRHPESELYAQIPDFWWDYPGESGASRALAGGLALVGVLAAALLLPGWRRSAAPSHSESS